MKLECPLCKSHRVKLIMLRSNSDPHDKFICRLCYTVFEVEANSNRITTIWPSISKGD